MNGTAIVDGWVTRGTAGGAALRAVSVATFADRGAACTRCAAPDAALETAAAAPREVAVAASLETALEPALEPALERALEPAPEAALETAPATVLEAA